MQGNLFAPTNPNISVLQKVIDKLNIKYKDNTVITDSCGFNKKDWKIKAEIRSPRYKARWNEILTVSDVLSLK